MITKIICWFEGKKTIIGIIIGTIYSLSIHFNFVENNTAVWTLIASYTGISYKLGINRISTAPITIIEEAAIPEPVHYIPPTPISEEPAEVKAG